MSRGYLLMTSTTSADYIGREPAIFRAYDEQSQ